VSRTSEMVGSAFNAGVRIDYTKNWECSHCPQQHITNRPDVHTPIHQCGGMRGAWVPFVPAGSKASLRINRREDYVGSDLVRTDGDGIPVMSVTTLREDGEDCMVFAPCATRPAVVDPTQ
jgi:hypothetical protein